MNITNNEQLLSVIREGLVRTLKEISSRVAEKLTQIVEQDWYANGADSTLWYERTYQFLNAIINTDVRRNGKYGYQVEVLIDPSLIQSQYNESTFFNQHMSLDGSTGYGGKSIGWWLVSWIEYGQNSPILSYSGIHMFKKTDEYINGNLDKMVINALKSFGFNVRK